GRPRPAPGCGQTRSRNRARPCAYRALRTGVEASLGWSSPGDHLALNGNITWQDLRNPSYEGGFGELVSDRVLPRLGCPLRARVLPQLESAGRKDTKQVVSSQPAHTAGVSYQVQRRVLAIT